MGVMEVIPAIDIRGGRCVRLLQGDFSQERVYAHDPVSVALRFQEEGAPRLHVVDLDGARLGRPVNVDAVRAVLEAVRVPVQVGGGLRDMESIAYYLGLGADRCVLGTAALEDEALLQRALQAFPGRIAVALDVREGRPLARGWLAEHGVPASQALARFLSLGVRHIIYTDVSVDGTLSHPRLEEVRQALAAVRAQGEGVTFIYSGGVASMDDLLALARLGVDGAIVGRALYEGAIRLPMALQALADA